MKEQNIPKEQSSITEIIDFEIGKNKTQLKLVKEDTPGLIVVRPNQPTIESVSFLVKLHLEQENWWVRPELLEQLGDLAEKWDLKVEDHPIKIYNFWRPLGEERATELQNAIVKTSQFIPESVKGLSDIIISGYQGTNDKSGLPTNGDWLTPNAHKTFRLYPAAFNPIKSRVTDKTTNLTGTTTHEIAHSLDHIDNEWREKFGWFYLFRDEGKKPRILAGGWESWEDCREMDKCITEYAKSDVGEDICESFVAYVYDPEKLDSGKREFLAEKFPYRSEKVESSIKLSNDLNIPKLPEVIPYVIKPSLIKSFSHN